MKLKIKDGRGELYQWDTGRKLIIEDGANIDYLHFADFSKDDGVSYQSEVIEENGIRCCRIPNACFANESTKLVVYAVEADDDGMATTTTVVFPIRKRQKPSDYTASPEIIISAEEILRKASAKADEAESYMNTSMQYAINAVDEVISGTDKYSSLHWASKANDIYNDVVEYVGSPSDPSSALGSIDTAKQSAITNIDAHVDTVKIDLTSYVENAESYSGEAASYASQALSYSTSASTSESNAKAAAEAAAAAESNSLSYKDLAETAKSNAQNARDEAVSAKNIAIETIVAIQGIESNVSSMKSSVDASEANVTTMQSDVSTMKASVETLKSETQTIVDNAENDVKGLLSTKADKTELAVERARIDSLSRLSEGSTTGDAELIDLRIGADGVTYGNAGTAVRTQISNLKGDLGEYTYTKTEGMYVNALGEIKPYEGAYDIYAIDVSLFNGRTISGHTTGYTNSAFGAFYKKDGSVISVVTNSGNDMPWEYSFVIPVGAEKFVIDYRTSGSGDFTVTIDNITQSFIDFAKVTKEQIETVTVGINGDYPSIIKALKNTNDRVKVRVLAGTYDLVHEFREYYSDDFFVNYDGYDAHPDDHFYKGMWINNGRVIEFDSKAKVIFNYNGENDYVKSQFSAFSMGYNATIRGLNLVYSGCRYAIHDDFARLNAEYHSGTNVIENCTFDGNPYFPAVIGGGFGDDNEYIIRNCLFLNNNQNNDVTYHNTYYENAKSKLIIENCYGNKDCKMFWYGLSELISDCIVTNNKFNSISCVAHSYEPNTNENIRLFAWNNITTN